MRLSTDPMAFLEVEDPRWAAMLTQLPHDVYHLPGYVRLQASHDGSEPAAFAYESGGKRMLLPLNIRGLDSSEWRDAITPGGYGAPLFSAEAGDAFIREAINAYVRAGRDARLLTTFVRLHPILRPTVPTPASVRWSVHEQGPTIALDPECTRGDDLLGMRASHRADIRALLRHGFAARVNDERDWLPFCSLYSATMRRVGARPAYHASASYFGGLREALGPALRWCAVIAPSGEVAAAGLFTTVDGIMQYHLSGSSAVYRKRAPSKLMIVTMLRWAYENGLRVLHLGGGVGARTDALFAFKAGFGGRRLPFRTLHVVHDVEAFEWACARWQREHGGTGFPDPSFFPPYRQQVTA